MLFADPFIAALQECIEVFMRHSMRNLIHSSREKGLSMSQVGALFFIHRTGSRGVTDLGDHLGVTSGAASQMLERLVQQDLVAGPCTRAYRRARAGWKSWQRACQPVKKIR
jgi:hypothetical protein